MPQQCTVSNIQVSGSTYIYFDLKPKSNGDIDVGLYTENTCAVEYTGSETTAQAVLTAYNGYDVALAQNLKAINSALDTFKVCTPCRTFNLDAKTVAPTDDANAQGVDPNSLDFVCTDAAGDTGVNQCMLFATTTQISSATTSDISMASQQGSITRTFVSSEGKQTWWEAWGFFFVSLMVFLVGLICFCAVAVKRKRVSSSSKNEPLMSRQ